MSESVIFCSFKKHIIQSIPIHHLYTKNIQNNANKRNIFLA
ncbi:hypothetical protein AO378_1137 [Moraxella catarrhalis]|nr:hypothetical protein AO378_1137 [Moraxella catarrhalis]